MRDTPLTVVGNLTDDPEIKFTPSGDAVARLTVATTPSYFDKRSGEWKDQETNFVDVTVWRQLAENVAATLKRGHGVIVVGNLTTQRWEDKETKKTRSRFVLVAQAIGPDLTRATADVKKMARRNDVAPDDPWATASKERPQAAQEPAPAMAGGTSRWDDEPPF